MDNKWFEQEVARAELLDQINKQPAMPYPAVDGHKYLRTFNMRLRHQAVEREIYVGQMPLRNTWIMGKAPCCTKPLAELKPIHLAQMKVPFVHEGHFLACRVLTESIVVIGTQVAIEDTKGHVQVVSFYNFNADLNNSSWLKPGTIVLIKEPYMKYSFAEEPLIRVETPSDAIFVHKSNRDLLVWAGALRWYEPETLSAEELKKWGNTAFKRGDFEDALGHYQRALALIGQTDELAPVIHLNMAAALLELKRYPETVEEAKKALDLGANKEKAFYRLGCAAYGMRRWAEAIGHFESALKVNPELSLTADKLAKAKARLAESLTGKYDLKKLLDDEKRGQRFMDVADYCGPVKVADIPGKGKGLIVTEDVKKGTLLLAEKAYAIAFEQADNPLPLQSLNFVTNELNDGSNVLCIIEAIQKLKREPQTAKELYELYAGERDPNWKMPTMEGGVIDAGRIERICSLNSFAPSDNKLSMTCEFLSGAKVTGTGLWILPSYANHSCVCNSVTAYFGDLMMVRTFCDLQKGDEVTLGYLSPLDTYEKRKARSTKKWSFQCDCHLCELDRQEASKIVKERNQLVLEFKHHQQHTSKPGAAGTALAKLVPLANAIRQTYRDRNELRTQMVEPLTALSYLYNFSDEPKKALEACKEILDSLGPQLTYYMVPAVHARMTHIYAHGTDNKKMAKNTALEAYQLVQHKYGQMDKKLFLQMYPEFGQFM